MFTKDTLMYKYRGDPNIGIGVLMIDNNLGISECGNNSITKNAVINSFVDTQRLEMHMEKEKFYMWGMQKNVINLVLLLKCTKK